MDEVSFVAQVSDHYKDQFENWLVERFRAGTKCGAEICLELSEKSSLYRRLFCVDFVENDEEYRVIEFEPEFQLNFDPMKFPYGSLVVLISSMRWDRINFRHNSSLLSERSLASWFDRWIDLEAERGSPERFIGNSIHSLSIDKNELDVDFGSAEPAAFWTLLDVLDESGATEIQVSTSA